MNHLLEIISNPEKLQTVIYVILGVLYLTGRITKGQLQAEQMKAAGMFIGRTVEVQKMTRQKAAEAANPFNYLCDKLAETNIPILPTVLKAVLVTPTTIPFSILSDIIFHLPIFGNKVD